MADLDVRCEPTQGAIVSVVDDVQGVSIDELERREDESDAPPPRTTDAPPLSPKGVTASVVALPRYLEGLRDGVERTVSGRGHVDLARFVLPLLTSDLSRRLETAIGETARARQNLQRTIELSDPSRAAQLATTRAHADAAVDEWRTELEQSVDSLRSGIAHAIAKTAAIAASTAHVRKELEREATNLRNLASDLDMGALRRVWEERLRGIVDEELEAMLRRIDEQERVQKEQAAASLREASRFVADDLDGAPEGEPLVDRYRHCACRQDVLQALENIRGTFVQHAAHLAR